MTKISGYEDCHMVNKPARTREELVEIMCRANTDHTVCGSDAMVYLSMEDCSNGARSPNWQRHQYDMGMALDALIAIGAVRIK